MPQHALKTRSKPREKPIAPSSEKDMKSSKPVNLSGAKSSWRLLADLTAPPESRLPTSPLSVVGMYGLASE